MTKCTIAIPVYNREGLIRRAVESALAQDVSDMEILVVDNCSTDHTWDVLHTYSDSRLRLVRNESNVGLFGNFNCCLNLAQGQYLRFLCSDDKLIHDCLRHEIAVMDAHPNVVLLSTQGRRIDEDAHILGTQAGHFRAGIYPGFKAIHAVLWFQAHYAYNPLNYPSGILIRRDAAAQAGQFDTMMRMSGDVDYFLRILEHGDLAVIDALGCEIMIHIHQESVHLTADIAPMLELYALVDRYRPMLQKEMTYFRIRQQLVAYTLGIAFKYWCMGFKEVSRAYLDIARRNASRKIDVAVAVLRLLSLRLLLRASGIRFLPVCPSQLLKDRVSI